MRKFKKGLAFALAAAMIATTVPVTASAAPTLKANRTTVYANSAYTSGSYAKAAAVMTSSAKKAGYKISYSTKNTKLVSLSTSKAGNVIVTAKTTGKERTAASVATVTVKATKGKSTITKNFKFNVKPAAYATSVSVDKTSLNVGDKAKATGKKATSKAYSTLRYYSSNPSVVKVVDNKTGELEAVAPGTAKITAKSTISLKSSKAVEVTVKADAPVATQTGESKITITNGVDMKDREVTVTKNGNKVDTKSITFSTDGKSVEIITSSKILEADYTVKVADKETTFKGQIAKITSIKFNSTKVALNGYVGSALDGSVGYTVLNQFGDDITKTTTVEVSSSTEANIEDGRIVFKWNQAPLTNTPVTAVLINRDSGITVTETLTVSDKALPSEVIVKGVYNEDNKALTASSMKDNDFYFLFQVKDQYGEYITKTDTLKDKTAGAWYETFAPGMTNLTITDAGNKANLITKKIGDVTYLGYKLEVADQKEVSAGTASLMIIPGGTGKTITTAIEVGAGNIVNTISVNPPSSVASGGKVALDYTALDAEGNAVTDLDLLKQIKTGSKKFYFVKEEGKVKLYFDDTIEGKTPANGYVTTVFQTPSLNKTTVVTISVKEGAYPAEIVNLLDADDKVLADAALIGRGIDLSKVKIFDQYGNEYKDFLDSYSLSVESDGDGSFTTTGTVDKIVGTTTRKVLEKGNTVTMNAAKEGTSTYTFKVVNKDGSDIVGNTGNTNKNYTSGSSYKITFVATTASKIRSYTVDDISKIYAEEVTGSSDVYTTPNDYLADLTVYGIVSGGAKIKLTADDYSVVGTKNLSTTSSSSLLIAEKVKFPSGTDEIDAAFNVVINKDGKEISKTTKVSKVAPKAKKFEFVNSNAKEIKLSAANLNAANLLLAIKGSDIYGKDLKQDPATGKFTNITGNVSIPVNIKVTDITTKDKDASVSKNGSDTPVFNKFGADDNFTVTFTSGDATFQTTVTVTN